MDCPACGQPGPDGGDTCPRCGLIFAKYRPRPLRPGPPAAAGGRWRELLLTWPQPPGTASLTARALLLGGLLWLSLPLVLARPVDNASGQCFLHLVNLPFHEAGHVFFRPFGALLHSLGGSLGQLLVPLICLGVLLVKTRDPFGAAVCTWWAGENLLDLAPYINDARAGVMPLLGGNTGRSSPYGFHDWEFILTETGLQRYDHTLAWLAQGVGTILMLVALGWGGWLLWRGYRGDRGLTGTGRAR